MIVGTFCLLEVLLIVLLVTGGHLWLWEISRLQWNAIEIDGFAGFWVVKYGVPVVQFALPEANYMYPPLTNHGYRGYRPMAIGVISYLVGLYPSSLVAYEVLHPSCARVRMHIVAPCRC